MSSGGEVDTLVGEQQGEEEVEDEEGGVVAKSLWDRSLTDYEVIEVLIQSKEQTNICGFGWSWLDLVSLGV